MKKIIAIFLIAWGLQTPGYPQSNYYLNETRWITAESPEGSVKCEVLTYKLETRTEIDLWYSWYNKGKLSSTQGAYYWKVRSWDVAGNYSEFSELRNFTVK